MTVDRGASRGKVPRITWGGSFAVSLVFDLWLDRAIAYDTILWQANAEGYDGSNDGRSQGERSMLAGTVRRIPRVDRNGVTGWEGSQGWRAFLQYGLDMQVFRWHADETDLATYFEAYLVEPADGKCGEEINRFRTIDLVIERVDGLPIVGY